MVDQGSSTDDDRREEDQGPTTRWMCQMTVHVGSAQASLKFNCHVPHDVPADLTPDQARQEIAEATLDAWDTAVNTDETLVLPRFGHDLMLPVALNPKHISAIVFDQIDPA